MINVGSLSLPLLKVNIAELLGTLPSIFTCSESDLHEKTVSLVAGPFVSDIRQMVSVLYPECQLDDSNVGMIKMDDV